jgi:hypothetical protein
MLLLGIWFLWVSKVKVFMVSALLGGFCVCLAAGNCYSVRIGSDTLLEEIRESVSEMKVNNMVSRLVCDRLSLISAYFANLPTSPLSIQGEKEFEEVKNEFEHIQIIISELDSQFCQIKEKNDEYGDRMQKTEAGF